MSKIFKYFLIGLTSLTLIIGAPALTYVLADDGSTEYLGSEPLPGSGDDGNTEYLGSEPLPPTPSCGDFTFRYPECDWDNQQVREVWQDSCGVFQTRNAHTEPGQCGAPAQVSPPAAPSCGDFTFRYPECDWDNQQVREVWQDSCGVFQLRNVHTQPGQCGAPTQVSQPPAPSPSPAPVQPAPAVGGPVTTTTNVTNNNTNTNVNANSNTNVASNTVTNTVQQTQSQSNAQTVNVPAGAPVSGLSVRFATVDCPAGTNKKVSGNEIICEIPQQVQQVKLIATEVAGVKTEVKELPKTGLPLLAWATLAFIPAGLRLKRFRQGLVANDAAPDFLWEERQFKARV